MAEALKFQAYHSPALCHQLPIKCTKPWAPQHSAFSMIFLASWKDQKVKTQKTRPRQFKIKKRKKNKACLVVFRDWNLKYLVCWSGTTYCSAQEVSPSPVLVWDQFVQFWMATFFLGSKRAARIRSRAALLASDISAGMSLETARLTMVELFGVLTQLVYFYMLVKLSLYETWILAIVVPWNLNISKSAGIWAKIDHSLLCLAGDSTYENCGPAIWLSVPSRRQSLALWLSSNQSLQTLVWISYIQVQFSMIPKTFEIRAILVSFPQ